MYSFCSLEALIQALCAQSRARICIHDLEGALYPPHLHLPPARRMHDAAFCDLAKDTPRGFKLCIRCKTRANKKAIGEGRPFSGYCPYGLYELARPVTFDGATVCIVYIGNLTPERKESETRLRAAARLTGANTPALLRALDDAQPADSLAPYERMADILESYIRLMLEHDHWKKSNSPQPGCRRKAREAAEYIQVHYNRPISLRQLSALYFVNEKYLGRVFRDEMGESMRSYLNRIRLEHAAHRLTGGVQSVLQIALECGFENISYFNRLFLAFYGMTPLQYRTRHTPRPNG